MSVIETETDAERQERRREQCRAAAKLGGIAKAKKHDMAELGAAGGSSTSAKKAAAARRNGAKGGGRRKPQPKTAKSPQ